MAMSLIWLLYWYYHIIINRSFFYRVVQLRCVRRRALELHSELPEKDRAVGFRASVGWAYRFMRRANLSTRRITSTGQAMPTGAPLLAKLFMQECRNHVMTESKLIYRILALSMLDFGDIFLTMKKLLCKKSGLAKSQCHSRDVNRGTSLAGRHSWDVTRGTHFVN